MKAGLDLTGTRYGRLVAQSFYWCQRTHMRRWVCLCDCGETSHVPTQDLRQGNTKSCGCLRIESSRARVLARAEGRKTV